MLGLGLASSHAPALFEPQEMWPLIYSRRPAYTKDSQPHTAKLETPAVIQGYIDRIHVAFDLLRQQLQAYRPEALIVVGDDQGDMFDDRLNPTFCIFTGKNSGGLTARITGPWQTVTASTSPATHRWPSICTRA